jgi:hypothetical protein
MYSTILRLAGIVGVFGSYSRAQLNIKLEWFLG